MTNKKSFDLFRLCNILSSVVIYNHCTNNIITGIGKVSVNFQYQYYSNSSFLGESLVQTNLLCAGQCIQNPICRTATFDKVNHYCSLYTEFTELGQLIQNNDMITFQSQIPRSCSNWTSENQTDYNYGDISHMGGLTSTECFQWCNMTMNCVGVTFDYYAYPAVTGTCWIKEAIYFQYRVNASNAIFWGCV